MPIKEKSFVHKGLQDFWESGGKDHSGISPSFAKVLRALLVHLDTSTTVDDIAADFGKLKGFKPLTGHKDRYELQVNGNYRLTFTCEDPQNGIVTKLDLEDVHRRGGAKRH